MEPGGTWRETTANNLSEAEAPHQTSTASVYMTRGRIKTTWKELNGDSVNPNTITSWNCHSSCYSRSSCQAITMLMHHYVHNCDWATDGIVQDFLDSSNLGEVYRMVGLILHLLTPSVAWHLCSRWAALCCIWNWALWLRIKQQKKVGINRKSTHKEQVFKGHNSLS